MGKIPGQARHIEIQCLAMVKATTIHLAVNVNVACSGRHQEGLGRSQFTSTERKPSGMEIRRDSVQWAMAQAEYRGEATIEVLYETASSFFYRG